MDVAVAVVVVVAGAGAEAGACRRGALRRDGWDDRSGRTVRRAGDGWLLVVAVDSEYVVPFEATGANGGACS